MELFLPNTLFFKKDVMLSIIWISVMSASIKGNLKLYRERKTAAILIIHYNYQYSHTLHYNFNVCTSIITRKTLFFIMYFYKYKNYTGR